MTFSLFSPPTVIGALPGNYSTASTASAFDPAWQIASNGTSSAPIRIVAKYSAVHMTDPTADTTASRLRHTGTTLGTAGVMVGGLSKEYQQWWGFLADENYGVAPEGAAVAHWYMQHWLRVPSDAHHLCHHQPGLQQRQSQRYRPA